MALYILHKEKYYDINRRHFNERGIFFDIILLQNNAFNQRTLNFPENVKPIIFRVVQAENAVLLSVRSSSMYSNKNIYQRNSKTLKTFSSFMSKMFS